jgi:hypothetical protein
MNRKQLTYTLRFVGSVIGFTIADGASATVIYPDAPFGESESIALPGVSASDFSYDYTSQPIGKVLLENQYFQAGAGEYLSAPNPTGPLASQTYNNTRQYIYAANEGSVGVNSIDLTFMSGGTTYYGEAFFSNDDELTEIDYGPASAPEPEAWALLLAGTGLAGAAMRARRRAGHLAA